jgi:hypothetical protein
MSKLTQIGCVYRGISGKALPKSFRERGEWGELGGVETAFSASRRPLTLVFLAAL